MQKLEKPRVRRLALRERDGAYNKARVNVNPPFVLPLHSCWSFANTDPRERLRMQRRRPVVLARYESILAGREGSIRGGEWPKIEIDCPSISEPTRIGRMG